MKSSPQPSKKIPVFIGYVKKYLNYPGALSTAQVRIPVMLNPTLITTAQISVVSRAKLSIEAVKLPRRVVKKVVPKHSRRKKKKKS